MQQETADNQRFHGVTWFRFALRYLGGNDKSGKANHFLHDSNTFKLLLSRAPGGIKGDSIMSVKEFCLSSPISLAGRCDPILSARQGAF